MAWDENGGPWGNNNDKNPWQKKPGGKGTPPDFDKWFNDQQKKFKKMTGGVGPNKNMLWLVAGGIFILWLLTGVYQVQNDQQAAILRFGEWDRTTEPGLHYHLPVPIETAIIQNVTAINVFMNTNASSDAEAVGDGSLMLTGDENVADVQFAVYWQINNLEQFLFSAKSPEATVKAAADSVFREVIAQTPIAQALSEGRADINTKVHARLQKVIDEYKLGITITQVKLLKVTPPTAEVVDAYLDVQRAKADMERKQNEAEFYHNSIVPVARGEAQKILQDAEAYKAQIVADAEGDTQRFLSVLRQYRAAPDITKKRIYLATMQTILASANKLVTNGADLKQGVLPYLPLPELKAQPKIDSATDEVKK